MSTMKGRIIVYAITGCPFCVRAKSAIADLGLSYVNVDVEKYPKVREDVKKRTGKQTVPQIFFNEIYIGGCTDLEKLIEEKTKLNELIEMVRTKKPPPDAPVPPDESDAVDSEGDHEFVCEPDEFDQFIQELKASGLVKDNRQGLKVYKNSFQGREFVKWVMKNKSLDQASAVELGQSLIDNHYGNEVKSTQVFRDGDFYYQLLDNVDNTALNGGEMSSCEPRSASQIGEEIRGLILRIYSEFLSKDGRSVDYDGIAASPQFEKFVKHTKELQRVPIEKSSRNEKIAFFINIYNALVIHGYVVKGPPTNLWQRYKFFNTVRYIIGGHAYSLQDIENGVLRGNKRGVGMITKPFSRTDPRITIALPTAEPLVHFALVCGAKSCPPIKTYSANEVMKQLKIAGEAFLETPDACTLSMPDKTVYLSMIFKWYRDDFGKNNMQVLQTVHSIMDDNSDKKNQLQQLIKGGNAKIAYLPYDWGSNKK